MKAVAHRAKRTSGYGPSLWLLVPALAFFVFFAVVPLIGVFVLSFTQWDGLGTPQFVGLDEWRRVLSDPVTMHSFKLTMLLTVLTWLIQTPISLLLGVFMAGKQRYRAVLAAIYFLPLLFSSAAVGITFKALLDPNFGISTLGLPFLKQDWLGDPNLAFFTVLFVISWCFIPLHSLLYQGGARQIPIQLYEAATLDGAGPIRQFFTITLPQLKYTIVTSSTLMIVGSLTYFDLIFVMTNGGPGHATRILPLHMYLTGFRSYEMGAAAVIGVILVVLGLAFSLALNKLSGAENMESQMEGV
ncbi:carbohydrate ABC transporter permease [Actinotignum sp. GS-2025a]|uniref:carbohydrate ABC transporter permease n=1 Tax=Actinotignum sp. GS-2025a TaxID=3427274 RepID=UPI003F48E93A